MLIHSKSSFTKGLLLMGSFCAVFFMIFMPLFPGDGGKALTGLEYSDDLFNKLSKGSSYFIPETQKRIEPVKGKIVDVSYTSKKAADAAKVFTAAGVPASADGSTLKVQGDLGTLLAAAVADSDAMYKNDGASVSARYAGMDHMAVMEAWWEGLNPMIKALQKNKMVDEANVIDSVLKRAVETGYNFYGIPAAKVMDKMGVMIGLLVFYVLYTMWYGFAIFELFDGIGLTMKKSKIKQEA
ncbi:MAG: hypothetical protein LBU75_06240 [Desulfovibrio sp.]|jgi:hypothetical protein|nr:hypothetical protein [Desulfovibrio sp.]